jgi:hypothetical protein
MLVGILLVYVVVLNMVLSNMMYTRVRQLAPPPPLKAHPATPQGPQDPPPLPPRRTERAAGLLVLVLVRTPQHPPAAPVARLLLQLRAVAWQTPPRVAVVVSRAEAMLRYNDWCLLTELQCSIAVLGDMSPAGLVQYIHNTDMCCTPAGAPTHDVVLLYDSSTVRHGFAQRVHSAARVPAVTCLQASRAQPPCQAYYVPAAHLGTNRSLWTV